MDKFELELYKTQIEQLQEVQDTLCNMRDEGDPDKLGATFCQVFPDQGVIKGAVLTYEEAEVVRKALDEIKAPQNKQARDFLYNLLIVADMPLVKGLPK